MLKAPRPGTVKTRLAATIGDDPATQLYRELGAATVATVQRAGWPLTIWYTPADAAAEMRSWLGTTIDLQPQPDGDLGARMAAAVAAAEPGSRLILLGGDCPGITVEVLRAANDALTRHAVVMVPSVDGGYVLLGGTCPFPDLFSHMEWSTSTVASETRRRLEASGTSWAELPALRDVDTADDARALGLASPHLTSSRPHITSSRPHVLTSQAWRVVAAVAVVLALLFGGRRLASLLPGVVTWIDGLGAWGPLAFVAAYAIAAVAFVPGSLLTLAAGALFGLGRGVAIAFVGATVGATLAFLVARYAARARVEQAVRGDARFAAIDRAIGRDGRRIVFLLRLSPIFPFNLLNYGLGLTTVRLRDFVVASIGMLPGTLLYVYYGKLAGDVAALAGGAAPARGVGHYAVLGLGLAATLLVTILVTRMARRALTEAVA